MATAHFYTPKKQTTEDDEVQITALTPEDRIFRQVATINLQNLSGLSALALSCERGHLDIVARMRVFGADLESRDSDQQTALHHAARGGHEALAE